MITSIKRIFISGWRSLSRDGGMITANIFIMAMAIFAISSLFLLKDVSQFLISGIQEKMDVSVYFKYDTLEEDILKTKEELSEIPEVKEVNYISREEALKSFIEKHKGNPILMESLQEVGANPFLPSLGVKAFQAHQYEAVVGFLQGEPFNSLIEKVDYYERKPVIESVYSATSTFNKVGLFFSIILIVVAALVTFNAIRLSIYNSKEEIKIQKLVGASNWFIKGQFLVQGAFCGFFAALICLALFALTTKGLDSRAESLFPGLGLFDFFTGNFYHILLIQLSTGITLGVVSSYIAVRKYLKI
jgi:cell division transport system permease protein